MSEYDLEAMASGTRFELCVKSAQVKGMVRVMEPKYF